MGGYRGSFTREVTAGVYRGRFNDLIGCGGDTLPIKCHNNDVIVVMGSINQSKSFTAGGHRGRFNDLIGCGGDT